MRRLWQRVAWVVAFGAGLMVLSCESPAERAAEGAEGAELIFARDEQEVARMPIPRGPAEQVTVEDPYFEATKTFRAVPLLPLLMEAYSMSSAELARYDFTLESIDGYAAPIPGARLTEPGAYVAFEDVEYAPNWEPIGPADADPAPLYLIWIHDHQDNTSIYPRPWQLRRVTIVSQEASRKVTAPLGLAEDHEAWAGYELFQTRCVMCHAINRSGGRVGPELNLPMNITEYREREQTLRFIRNAQAFRYSQMPAFEDLSPAELASLWSYLEAMRERKIHPEEAAKSDRDAAQESP
ncbi:hypothetical protein DL240_17515 [Lujinxingia litoralis]|uniref:Cytochrome c domain-containing protein n=1 Tax=Lujinxingia litoralis TaxID=2211119 RepID=A0A328C273_9DELT|nr:cytochrome c [Lujinxingia litoralis]RAL20379.1 hypothetical protein DL240_17515 [Lujinxingia litoralis]